MIFGTSIGGWSDVVFLPAMPERLNHAKRMRETGELGSAGWLIAELAAPNVGITRRRFDRLMDDLIAAYRDADVAAMVLRDGRPLPPVKPGTLH
ncbi:MAG TPA: hypothetical protein VKC66_34685 [Xanthobacteraceae bacterium]|nr:hypothetical protein [Xanthobacteraceae bacterium]